MIYAVNASTLAVSEYQDLSVTDIAVLDGALYGIKTDGLVEFTGDDDEGVAIAAYMQTGKITLDSFEETRYARAYVRDKYGDALTLTSLVDQVNAEGVASVQSVAYSIPAQTGNVNHAHAERLRRDVKGTSWAWKLANVSGGGMSIRGFSVQPEGIEVDV